MRSAEEWERELEQIQNAQIAIADRYEASGHYPPAVIKAIHTAAHASVRAARNAISAGALEARTIALAIKAAHEPWAELWDDEDGYGAATFHEVAAAVDALRDSVRS